MRRPVSITMSFSAVLAVVGFALAFIGLALVATPVPAAHAQTTGTATVGTVSNGTPGAAGTIYVFCLDYGKDFPTGQSIAAQGLAQDNIRTALNYALTKGYIQSNPYQVQLAMWKLSNGDFHDINNQGTTIAQEIVNNASGTAPTGSASDVGTLTISNIQPADAVKAYGTGTVNGTVPANAPVGFLLPASASNFQRLISVVVGAAQTTTTAAATTAAATTAAATTAAATTAAATTDASATATSIPTVSGAPATGNGGNTGDTGPNATGLLLTFLGLLFLVAAGIGAMAVARRRALR